MVNDSKAEALEAKGLYRRAATRWQEVMMLCAEDDDREWIKRHSETCLEKVKRPPVKVDDYGDLHKAATDTQHRMGIAQPNGSAFRLTGRKQR
ncbi:PerC family transcriptional regulator [Enterobacter vonholyi]